jgi:phytoene dehydrogenase-like protein
MVVSVFLTFRGGGGIFPPGVSTFFVPYDILHEFEMLEIGRFPEKSMFILHVPSNAEDCQVFEHSGTLQFYYPKGIVDPDWLKRQVDLVLHKGLSDLAAGLEKSVANYLVYDPSSYREAFGFYPRVFGVAPDRSAKRFGIQTAIQNLFCVGDSVEPEGPCVAQAMESGIKCAKQVQELLKERV